MYGNPLKVGDYVLIAVKGNCGDGIMRKALITKMGDRKYSWSETVYFEVLVNTFIFESYPNITQVRKGFTSIGQLHSEDKTTRFFECMRLGGKDNAFSDEEKLLIEKQYKL